MAEASFLKLVVADLNDHSGGDGYPGQVLAARPPAFGSRASRFIAKAVLGAQLLELSQQFTANPSKLYAAVLFSALAGILFVSLVTLAERWWMARAAIPEAR